MLLDAMASQLNSVRLKLEQRRKRIEEEKRKMESVMEKQREKVGQQAFFKAVIKGVNLLTKLIFHSFNLNWSMLAIYFLVFL